MTPQQLSDWLEIVTPPTPVRISGHTYFLLHQFRMAIFVHCVFYDVPRKEYTWFIIENNVLYEQRFNQAKRYSSYREMICDVASHFTMYPSPSPGFAAT